MTELARMAACLQVSITPNVAYYYVCDLNARSLWRMRAETKSNTGPSTSYISMHLGDIRCCCLQTILSTKFELEFSKSGFLT